MDPKFIIAVRSESASKNTMSKTTHEPISFAGGVLDHFCHVCAFDSWEKEQWLLDPFLMDGVECGDTLSLIVNPAERPDWVRHFRRLGLDVSTLLDQGRLMLQTWPETHLRGGHVDQDGMLRLSDELMGRSRSTRIR